MATSIVPGLIERAATHPEDTAFIFVGNGDAERARISFGDLDARARALAAAFRASVPPGEPLLLMVRPDIDSVVALCACLYGGVLCVPIPTPGRNASTERILAIAAASGARSIHGSGQGLELQGALPSLRWLAADGNKPSPLKPASYEASDPAILQYTSGSTNTPSGAVLTHGNLSANLEMLGAAFAVGAKSRFLSWLPLHHDMGLLVVLMCLHFGFPGVLMSPLAFVQKPQKWLEAIARFGATISGAPNFAYEACVTRSSASEIAKLDLTLWTVAFCGGEPIRPATLQKFAAMARPAQFERSALFPCYGLAEATTFVSGRHLLWVESGSPAIGAMGRVSCGSAPEGTTIEIVDPDSFLPCGEGSIGEIWVSGDHVAIGYWRAPPDQTTPFGASLRDRPGLRFLRTGDLGFLADNQLYVTGRLKDVIIHRGQNIHAVDVEETVAASHPAFGSVGAAFACVVDEHEQVVVVHEVARSAESLNPEDMLASALDAAAVRYGVRLYDLVLVRPGKIPKTTSGKVRRALCSRLYEEGLLDDLTIASSLSLGRSEKDDRAPAHAINSRMNKQRDRS